MNQQTPPEPPLNPAFGASGLGLRSALEVRFSDLRLTSGTSRLLFSGWFACNRSHGEWIPQRHIGNTAFSQLGQFYVMLRVAKENFLFLPNDHYRKFLRSQVFSCYPQDVVFGD